MVAVEGIRAPCLLSCAFLSGSNSQTLCCPDPIVHSNLNRVGRLFEKVAERWCVKTLDALTPEAAFPDEEIEKKGVMADTPAEPRSFSSSLLPLSGIVVQNFVPPRLTL